MEKKKYRIIYVKKECIGAYACVSAEPSTWKEAKAEDKADLIGGINEGDEVFVKEVDSLENNMEAAQSCPVNCIHIIDNETGKKLI